MPSAKEADGRLIGGTVNGTGSVFMRADNVGSDPMLSRIVAMVAEAQRSRAPIQRHADTVAAWFVPAVAAGRRVRGRDRAMRRSARSTFSTWRPETR
jgi:Cu+-exporting ATPase